MIRWPRNVLLIAAKMTRWLSKIALAIVTIVISMGAVLWAIWWLLSRFSPQWDPRSITASAIVALVFLAATWWLWWQLLKRQVRRLDIQIPPEVASGYRGQLPQDSWSGN